MIIRVPLGTSVEIVNASSMAPQLPPEEQPLTMQDWSTLANVCSAYLAMQAQQWNGGTRAFISALRDKCNERLNALSHGVVVP